MKGKVGMTKVPYYYDGEEDGIHSIRPSSGTGEIIFLSEKSEIRVDEHSIRINGVWLQLWRCKKIERQNEFVVINKDQLQFQSGDRESAYDYIGANGGFVYKLDK